MKTMTSQSNQDDYDTVWKLALAGESGVGKTNLLSRFTNDDFKLDTMPTIGVDFASRLHKLEGKVVKAQIWDTAGQERYRAITTAYYRGAAGILLVYDVTRKDTYEKIPNWLQEIKQHAPEDAVVVLVGNKSDLGDQRCVQSEEGQKLAAENGLFYIETSARDSSNVTEAFELLLNEVNMRSPESINNIRRAAASVPVRLPESRRARKNACC